MILIGGHGVLEIPENLISGLVSLNTPDLTIVSSSAGVDDYGVGALIKNNQVKRLITSDVS